MCVCVCVCVCVVRGHRSALAVVLCLLLSAPPCVSSLLRNCLLTFLSSSSSSSSCSTRCVCLVFFLFCLLILFGVSAIWINQTWSRSRYFDFCWCFICIDLEYLNHPNFQSRIKPNCTSVTQRTSLEHGLVCLCVVVFVKMSLELMCILLFRNYVFQKRYVKFDGKNLMYFGSDKVQTAFKVFLMYLMSLQNCLQEQKLSVNTVDNKVLLSLNETCLVSVFLIS